MSHFSRFAVVALLAASLAPVAAQARSGSSQPAANQQLIALQSAPAAQAQGRASERTAQPAAFTVAPTQPEYAVASDDGYLG